MEKIKVGNRKIGEGEPIFFISECGINHNGQLSQAKKLIDVAVDAECSAAKFQTFRADAHYIPQAGKYHLNNKDIDIYELHERLSMPEEWLGELSDYCRQHDIIFFSTPADPKCVDLIDKYVPCYKVSSYDMTNRYLTDYLNTKGKPVIFSTGGAYLSEISETHESLTVPHAILHCIAKYPAPLKYANLAVMETLKRAFGVPVGFSSNGFVKENGEIDTKRIPYQVAVNGADLFETHITLDRKGESVDDFFATEPQELKEMVKTMQQIRESSYLYDEEDIDPLILGSPIRKPYDIEEYCRKFLYKCLFAKKDIAQGERFTSENVAVLRPGEYPKRGLEPKYYELITTKATAKRAMKAWEAITWSEALSTTNQ